MQRYKPGDRVKALLAVNDLKRVATRIAWTKNAIAPRKYSERPSSIAPVTSCHD
jgi:hypothetical protein